MHVLSTFTSSHQFVLELSELRGSNWSANARVIICSLPPRCPAAPMRSIRSCELSWSSLFFDATVAADVLGCGSIQKQLVRKQKKWKTAAFQGKKNTPNDIRKIFLCVCVTYQVCVEFDSLCVFTCLRKHHQQQQQQQQHHVWYQGDDVC